MHPPNWLLDEKAGCSRAPFCSFAVRYRRVLKAHSNAVSLYALCNVLCDMVIQRPVRGMAHSSSPRNLQPTNKSGFYLPTLNSLQPYEPPVYHENLRKRTSVSFGELYSVESGLLWAFTYRSLTCRSHAAPAIRLFAPAASMC